MSKGDKIPERMHERDYTLKGFRQHMLNEHGTRIGTVRLAAYLSHRRKHAAGWMKVPHTHSTQRSS